MATEVAKNYFKNFHDLDNREISEQVTATENGETYFYLFNFKQGGFLIVAADYREYPILAHDLINSFPTKGDVNPGLGIWFSDTRDRIQALRKNQITPTKMAIHLWEDLKNRKFISTFLSADVPTVKNPNQGQSQNWEVEEPDCDGGYITIHKNPLMTTTWGQGCGYNSELDDNVDPNNCDHYLTGCVPTSMAQVMRYHSYPNFEWMTSSNGYSSMPNALPNYSTTSTATSTSIARLMERCGSHLPSISYN